MRHYARRPVARTPFLWDSAMLARPSKRATLARRETSILIDGFLRSGNTFSVAAFQVANGTQQHVARHLHGAPHFLRAVRLGIPAVLLIRDPADAVASYLVRRPTLTPLEAVQEYLDFYRTTWRVRRDVVVGVFEQVVSDFGSITDAVNQRFGTSFSRYEPTPENEKEAFRLVEEMNRLECRGELVESHVGRPSRERERRSQEIRAALHEPKTKASLAEGRELFGAYAALARYARDGRDPG